MIIVLILLFGGDPSQVLRMLNGGGTVVSTPSQQPGMTADDEDMQFVSAVLAMTEDVWSEIFAASGSTYSPPTLVLFTDAVESACGYNSAATGPFYCPPDQNLYLDTGFFEELARLGGPGEFARAYVIGHEVGHHIQTLVGTSREVQELKRRSGSQAEANRLQVLMELQADCYAGVWANRINRAQNILEPGDVENGMAAAGSIGDDRLLRRAGRAVSPESFTHGTAAQRQRWLGIGMQTGRVDACNTFAEGG